MSPERDQRVDILSLEVYDGMLSTVHSAKGGGWEAFLVPQYTCKIVVNIFNISLALANFLVEVTK